MRTSSGGKLVPNMYFYFKKSYYRHFYDVLIEFVKMMCSIVREMIRKWVCGFVEKLCATKLSLFLLKSNLIDTINEYDVMLSIIYV